MKLTRANRFALYVSVGATATLASPALAAAETQPTSGLPVQPCVASSSLPVANPLPCPAGGAAAPATVGASGAAGANASGAPGANGANGAAGRRAAVKRHVKVKAHARSHRVRHSRHARRHANRRHH
jgi:hypothetical protein